MIRKRNEKETLMTMDWMKTNVPVPDGAGELVGFVPFAPKAQRSDTIEISFTHTYSKLSQKALVELGTPEAVVFFFDYSGKRMMVVPGERETENAVAVTQMPKAKNRRIIVSKSLQKEIEMITEHKTAGMICAGHRASVQQPTLIFDLKKMEKR